MSYEDLDLRIQTDGQGLCVAARRGSQHAKAPFALDLSQSWALEDLERRGTAEVRKRGAALFEALFRDTVRDLYQQGRGGTGSDANRGLRIRIQIDPRDEHLRPFMNVPWEILRDPAADANQLPALDSRRPVVRMIDSNEPPVAPAAGPLECVLLVTANPVDTELLDLQAECEKVKHTLERTGVRPTVLRGATRSTLNERIWETAPQIVHFMGHGSFDSIQGEGVLILEGPDRARAPLHASRFATFFVGRAMPRLVILNSCLTAAAGKCASSPFASVAAALVAAGLPAVIAMQSTIRDDYAGTFADRLYRALRAGDSIEAAVTTARVHLHGINSYALDWASPVLYVRADGGGVVDVPKQPEISSSQPPTPPASVHLNEIYGPVALWPTGPISSHVDVKK